VISCHKHNLKSVRADSIYRIISSKKQKGKPSKTDLPSWKTISQVFEASDIYMFIADTWNFVFEMAPSADNCIVGPDYSTEAYLKAWGCHSWIVI